MSVENWEFEYNGFVFGGDNAVSVIEIEGLSPPDVKLHESERMAMDGSFIYARHRQMRRLVLNGDVHSADNFEFMLDRFRSAFLPQVTALPLTFKIPDAEPKRIYCKPSKQAFPYNSAWAGGYVEWQLELLAEDPYIYSDAESSFVLTPPSQAGLGIDFSVDLPANFGGEIATNTDIAYNAGLIDAPPVVTFTGPVVGPAIENVTYDESFIMNLELLAGEELVVDFNAKTVVLDGTSSRYAQIVDGSKFWKLRPGNNTIRYFATGPASGSSCEFAWRSVWV